MSRSVVRRTAESSRALQRGAGLALRHAAFRHQARAGKHPPPAQRARRPRQRAAHHPCRRHQRQRLRLRDDRRHLPRARLSHRPLHLPSPDHLSRAHSCEWRDDRRRGSRGRLEPAFARWCAIGIRIRHFSKSRLRSRCGTSSAPPARSSCWKQAWAAAWTRPTRCTPVVSVITPIGYDHQKWLGDTLTEIAAEKAGIIKPHVPVVAAPQPEAAAVIRARATNAARRSTSCRESYRGSQIALAGKASGTECSARDCSVTRRQHHRR